MTVTYTREVADCKGLGCFWKLLFRWRGSIYKLIWPDLIMYTILYYILSLVYRLVLDAEGKRIFEKVSMYCQYFSSLIPLSFVLGFYVNIVVQRWWSQYQLLPWPDSLSLLISTSIQGQDDRSRMMRRTIVRYVNLASTMTLRLVCLKVKKRFPTYDHFLDAGLLELNEKNVLEAMESKSSHSHYWMPLVWAGSIVTRARRENKIRDDFAVKTIIDEINKFRGNLGGLLSYDWISVPLVYTQVVTLAVYTFFLSSLMGGQFLDPKQKYDKHMVDFYIPFFTYLQFFFYMGWLKVAESLLNPFGEDDDDFEVNWLIDRNVQIAYVIVDEMHNNHPEMIQDMYWAKVFPVNLPYTAASEGYRKEPPSFSTDHFTVSDNKGDTLPRTSCEDLTPVDEEKRDGNSFSKVPLRSSSLRNPMMNMLRKGSILFGKRDLKADVAVEEANGFIAETQNSSTLHPHNQPPLDEGKHLIKDEWNYVNENDAQVNDIPAGGIRSSHPVGLTPVSSVPSDDQGKYPVQPSYQQSSLSLHEYHQWNRPTEWDRQKSSLQQIPASDHMAPSYSPQPLHVPAAYSLPVEVDRKKDSDYVQKYFPPYERREKYLLSTIPSTVQAVPCHFTNSSNTEIGKECSPVRQRKDLDRRAEDSSYHINVDQAMDFHTRSTVSNPPYTSELWF